MTRLELLNSRGFRDEKHLAEFLETCNDEGWKADLIKYFGSDSDDTKTADKVIEEVKTTSKKVNKTKED